MKKTTDNKIHCSFQKKTWLTTLIVAFFVAYPNNAWFLCDLGLYVDDGDQPKYFAFFILRFLMFWLLSWLVLKLDFRKLRGALMGTYLGMNLVVVIAGFAVYEAVMHILPFKNYDHFLSMLIFQFIFLWLISTSIAYIDELFDMQRRKDREIERLKIDSLESRCNALTNQINPHFFFNSLNGITSLVRKGDNKQTIGYIDELSDTFRYILQSEKKSLVPLDEELQFVGAYKQIMQVRYANKLNFDIDVHDGDGLCLPVLSLLPLLENVITHNTIDSEHIMNVSIRLDSNNELSVENPIYPKLNEPATHGTGIKNLGNRFELLLGTKIRVENDGKTFRVVMPLKAEM